MATTGILLPKGSLEGIILSIIIFMMSIYYGLIKMPFRHMFYFVYLFSFFIFLLILLNSSNYLTSYKDWTKISIGLLSLPAGFNIFNNERNIRKFWKVLIIVAHIYIANSIISNIYHLGGKYGGNNPIYETGNLFSEALYVNIYTLTLIPFFLRYNIKRIYVLVILGICAVLVIVNMKRTPILCGVLSFFVFTMVLFLLNYRYKPLVSGGHTKFYLVFLLFFCVSFLFFQDTIDKQIEKREKKLNVQNLNKEGRILEFRSVYEETVIKGNPIKFLFGKETLNTVGNYASGKFGNRMIHQDYTLYLHSTGVFGLLWYIGIHLYLLLLPLRRRYRYLYMDNYDNRLLLGTYISFICVYLVAMGSGISRFTFSTVVFYMFIGMTLRIFYQQHLGNSIFEDKSK